MKTENDMLNQKANSLFSQALFAFPIYQPAAQWNLNCGNGRTIFYI
jgi:hypothetical protein